MTEEKTKDTSRQIWFVLLAFSLAFIVGALLAGDLPNLIPGLITICTRPSQFTMDYFVLGGLGSTFLNTGLVGLACCGLLYFTGAKCSGLTVAAYWLNVGFSSFGMNFLNIWPFFIGTFLYSRIRKVSFGSMANMAMFCTSMGPFASELIFRYPYQETVGFRLWGLILALLLGFIVSCAMPSLCAMTPFFHKGYDLYSAAPAAGFLAFLIYCVLYRSPGVEVPSNTNLGPGARAYVNAFFLIVFGLCLVAGWLMDGEKAVSQYKKLWAGDSYKTDYTEKYGIAATLLNMGFYGLFILLYYNVVRGFTWTDGQTVISTAKFTGATMGAIMCMYAFCAQGAQPRNVFPIAVGYALASVYPYLMARFGVVPQQNWCLTTQAILVGMCFASGLAPVSGKKGFAAGVAAGAMHATLVMSVPLWHGGFCLYNGGFTAGVVAFLLIPVIEWFAKGKDNA